MRSSVIVEQLPLSELNSAVALHLLCPACKHVCQAAPILHASPDDGSSTDLDEATNEEEITTREAVVAKADTIAKKEGTARDETAGVEEDIDDSASEVSLLGSYWRKQYFKHHQSFIRLKLSAEQGCHLCSLLYKELSSPPVYAAKSLVALESRFSIPESQDLEHRKTSYGIGFGKSSNYHCTIEAKFVDIDDLSDALVDSGDEVLDFQSDHSQSEDSLDLSESISSNVISEKNVYRLLNVHCVEAGPSHQTIGSHPQQCSPKYTASEASFLQILEWLNNCIDKHRLCRQASSSPTTLPTRLIDVGLDNGSRLPFLSISHRNDTKREYLALSHCWGVAKILQLATSNYEALQKCIDMEDIPLTFQHAIFITRRLRYQYLWIDSLCIIQDSPDDWKVEAQKMQDVYSHCLLTIAALWGADSHAGCFTRREPLEHLPCRIFQNTKFSLFARSARGDPDDFGLNISDKSASPLIARAWVLQERLLSPRTVFFGPEQVHWECLECGADEKDPSGFLGWLRVKKRLFGLTSPDKQSNFLQDPQFVENFYHVWPWILEAYTTAHLTFCTDLLVAIGGLSSFIEARTGLHFVWGHWKELLPLDLLWHVKESIMMDDEDLVKKREKRTKSGIFPTWSWPSMMIDNERDKLSGSIIWGRDGDFIFDSLKLLSEVLSVSSDQQARQDSITWGVLVLRGAIFPALSYSDLLQLPSVRTMIDIALSDNEEVYRLVVFRDPQNEDLELEGICGGLLLRVSTIADEELYGRVGYWEQKETWLESSDCEEKEVMIR